MLLPVILAGGAGTRLWPLSRQLNPKQFLKLTGERTMIQDTVGRLEGLTCVAPILVCSEEHRFLAAEQMRQLGFESPRVLLEPCPRNTAPAIALAALQALADCSDPLLLVLPADHLIQDVEQFHSGVEAAIELAESGMLVTFGVVADKAETGYGYIQRGDQVGLGYKVTRFVEKPSLENSSKYLQSGDYFWNSGMFLFRASAYLNELRLYKPEILEACEVAFKSGREDLDFIRIDRDAFSLCPSDSIDYAVMEKTQCAVMVPFAAQWSDIGSWSALWDVSEKDASGNVLSGDALAFNSDGCLVKADSRLVAVVGGSDLVVVETKDAVLVAARDKVQDIKAVVEQLNAQARPETISHRTVYRPWGMYDSIDVGARYQVKRITVNPGARLSLQMHHHRAEHWIVVSGTARVIRGSEDFLVTENQSTFIPVGQVHSLENPGRIPLELIEVQSGGYLGEDDIIRLEDRYGRA